MSALFSAPASAVKAGRNTLQLAIYEQEVNTLLPGPVELRRARLDDRVQLNSFTRTAGDNATETILLVQQSLPGSDSVALTIEMQDDVGLVLWTETPALDFTKGKLQQAIPIKPLSLQDYKAVVRATAPGQPVVEHWAYTHQAQTQPSTVRDEFKLTTTNWEYRPISQDEKVTLPPPTNGWKKGKQGTGAADGYKHRYYFRTTFTAPAELAKGRALLGIGEMRMKGDFFLNGQEIGTRRYYDVPFELDITGVVKPGQPNELIVVLHDGMTPEFLTDGTPPVADGQKEPPALTSRFHFDRLDWVRLNHLSLRRVPAEVRVLRNRIVTSVKARTLSVTSTLENASTATLRVTPSFTVKDRTGKVLSFLGTPVTVPARSTVEATTTQPWADAKLWSPDFPYLYALEITLSAGKTLLDAHRERFGFREIEVVGKNFVLNGEIIRFRTLAPSIILSKGNNQDEPDFYKYNTNIAALRASKEVGFNSFRIRDANTVRAYYAACDEIGLATGILSELVDNHNNRIAFTDPVTWENSYKELVSSHQSLANHASALWYDLGNENIAISGPSSDPKVADFLYANEQKIRAYDPTRFVFSSGAIGGYDGRAQVFSPHYPYTAAPAGAFMPTQWWYFTTRYQDIPKTLLDRTLWPDSDPTNRYKGMTQFPGGAWANVPIFNDEYAWMQDWSFGKIDGISQPWAGERALKPFSPRFPNGFRRQMWNGGNWRNYAIGDHLSFLERIEFETQAYRAQGLAGLQRWDIEYRLPEGPHMPVVAFLREHVRSYFDDAPVVRTLYAVNDAVSPVRLDLQVRIHRLAPDGTRTLVQTERFAQTLQPGEIVQRALTIPAQQVAAPTAFLAEVVRNDGGTERFLHRQQWTVFPRSWVEPIPKDARIALYDPRGTSQGLFESLGAKPQLLANPAEIAKSGARLLVIGEDADVPPLENAAPQLAAFLRGGGTLFALRQAKELNINAWLPLRLEGLTRTTLQFRLVGGTSALTARHHPLFDGLLPSDLINWGPHGLVFGSSYKIDGALPNARLLAGLAPFSAQVIEGTFGQGRWIASTLELTPETVKVAPPAARVLANLVRWAQSAPPTPAPARAAVYAPKDAAAAQALQNTIKLTATFTDAPPALGDLDTLILAGWAKTTPPDTFAAQIRPWLEAGGTLVVQGGGSAVAPWLEKVTGRKVTAEPALDNSQGSKLVVHPLLDGIFEGDLQWDEKPRKFDQPGTFTDLLLRVEGATELIHPAALSVTTVGKGRVVINQTRWSEAKEAPRAQRFQRTLLTNLGLRMQALDYGSRRERFTVPDKLAFTPLSLGAAPTLVF